MNLRMEGLTNDKHEPTTGRIPLPNSAGIGGAVSVFRSAANMKQITLAHHAGVTERTVQRVERGEKVNDESLRSIACALGIDEKSFSGPRYVPSKEEAVADVLKELQGRQLIEARRFVTLKDAEAVLGTHGMLIDDHFVADDAATEAADLKDLLRDWNDIYPGLCSAGEKLNACRSLLDAAKKLEPKGYVIRYGVHTTKDKFQMVIMLFARKADEARCEIKQLLVPSRFTEMAVSSLEES